MAKGQEKYFRGIYIGFALFLSALCLLWAGVITVQAYNLGVGKRMLLFPLLLGVGAAVFLLLIRRGVGRSISDLDAVLDCLENGKECAIYPEETEVSKLGEKLRRYAEVQRGQERQLSAQKQQVEGLISDISHQTKTPIANLLLYGQLLEQRDLPEKEKDYIRKMNSQAERLKWLVETMVNTSRLETGMVQCSPREDSVMELVVQALNQVFARAQAKDIEIRVECGNLEKALFDRKWTAEALYNLLDNSVKYTSSGGTILIKAVSYEMYERIDVCDTGIGIPQEEWNKIFGRFCRGSLTKDQEGVGIGLYLAREIVGKQQGYLTVSSHPGQGSVFSMYLPKTQK